MNFTAVVEEAPFKLTTVFKLVDRVVTQAVAAVVVDRLVTKVVTQFEAEGFKADMSLRILLAVSDLLSRCGSGAYQDQLVRAYDLTRQLSQGRLGPCRAGLDKPLRAAGVVIREALSLVVCLLLKQGFGNVEVTKEHFEDSLRHVFNRQLGPDIRAQFHRSRHESCRIGRDRNLFMRQAPRIYGDVLDVTELDEIWPAYQAVALMTWPRRPR